MYYGIDLPIEIYVHMYLPTGPGAPGGPLSPGSPFYLKWLKHVSVFYSNIGWKIYSKLETHRNNHPIDSNNHSLQILFDSLSWIHIHDDCNMRIRLI